MLNKLDSPTIITIKDIDKVNTKYITNNSACTLLGISHSKKICTLDLFLTTYIHNNNKYFKKEDVVSLCNFRNKLEKTIELCPVLGLKDPKGVKHFLEAKNIRFFPYKTHPFGSFHLYYKEDLEYIKEMYLEFRYEVKIQQANLHKHSIHYNYKNNKSKISEELSYLKKAIEIEIFTFDEYLTKKEALKFLKRPDLQGVSLDNFLQLYSYNYTLYYKKSDVVGLFNKFKNTISLSSCAKSFDYSICAFRRLLREDIKIKVLEPGSHPYCNRILIYTEDLAKIKDYLYNDIELSLDNYISYQDTINLFGVSTPAASINKFSVPIKYKSQLYYLKKDILILLKYRKDTVTLLSLEKKYAELIGDCALRTLLISNNIELIHPKSHPFNFGILVYKDDLPKIDNLVNIRSKVNSTENRYDKFKILISQIPVKKSIEQTLNDFSKEFIYERFKKISNKSFHLSLYKTYELLNDLLKKNIYEYSKDDVSRFISIVFNDDRYTMIVKKEFVNFCNFIDNKYNSSISMPYVVNKTKSISNPKDTSSYSRDQLLNLFYLLYSSLDDRDCICKALDNRNYAMIWLYMLMHYVSFWRSSTIQNIPTPNLKLIGFDSGYDFIEWCRNPSNTFTCEMGIKICSSVKIQIDSLVITAKKNNKPLVFEYGQLMARGLGFLFALCESHRKICEQDLLQINLNKKSGFRSPKDITRLITSNFRNLDHFIGLFGENYIKILGKTIFSNLKCEKAFNNYTLDYSEDKNIAIGSQILSIMRSHSVNIKGISNTTTTYETRVEEGTIGEIESTLQEIGAFGFAKNSLLSICDELFKSTSLGDKKQKMLNLSMTPMQIESVSKSIYIQRETVLKYLNKMIVDPTTAENILRELAYGHTSGKHIYSRCLLKAIINGCTNTIVDAASINLVTDLNIYGNCLFPDSDSCFSCPLLIGEMYLLYELNEVICNCIKSIATIESSFERRIQSSLLFNSYFPILYAAQDVLGEDILNTYIDIDYITNSIEILEQNNKLLL